ncbi:MAG TPA: ABC transporter permease [Saprospiraceae bacterium]|nr:ABC transporter permease [Saprospiraceae bacterium]
MTKKLRPAFWILGVLLFLALARDFIANGRPLYCRIGGASFWPGLRTVWKDPNAAFADPALDSIRVNDLWKTYPYDAVIFAPVPFSPGEIAKPPFPPGTMPAKPGTFHPQLSPRFRHWLGTDDRGRDVAAGFVAGARSAVLTGVIAMTMAMGIGLLMGALAGFWGDDRLRVRRGRWWLTLLGLLPASFYAFMAREHALDTGGWSEWLKSIGVFIVIVLFFNGLGKLLNRIPFFGKMITLPADMVIMRLAEMFNSIPGLIFIYVMAALLPKENQSIWVLIVLIGVISWTGVARFIRADLLRVRELDYVAAARGLGFSEARVLLRHALPNAMRSTMIAFAFGVATAVILEASLSFLGFGSYSSNTSWGTLLNSARAYPTAWWVALPPGLAICLTVLALNAIGERLSERKES